MKIDYNFSVRWELQEQVAYYSSPINIDFPITIVVKEYKSNAVIWSVRLSNLEANTLQYIVPAEKHYMNYEEMEAFTGIKFCVYNTETEEQLYEQPFFKKFYNIHTSNLSNLNSYYHIYIDYFLQKVHDKWLNKKYNLVVDVGANVGVFTEAMLELYECEKIVAIECNENLVNDLKRSYKNNSKVDIINKALHHSNKNIEFYQCDTNPGISTTASPITMNNNTGIPFTKTVIVETITIQDLVNLYGKIDLLKIDIEGGEYEIIEKVDNSVFDNINNLLIECHFLRENHKYVKPYYALITKLLSAGYTVEEFLPNQIYNSNMESESIYAYKTV